MIAENHNSSSDIQLHRYNRSRDHLVNLVISIRNLLGDISEFHCISNALSLPRTFGRGSSSSKSQTPLVQTELLRIFKFSSNIEAREEFDEATRARLLSTKFREICSHLDKLQQRLLENSSRVLVTGDVNSGKSTFVNRLLGTEIVPVDEQPCTQAFCEVTMMPSNFENFACSDAQIHAIADPDAYDASDIKTFRTVNISDLKHLLQAEDSYPYFRIYPKLRPSVDSSSFEFSELSVIDSPGLNCDVVKTTALFAKQDNIDSIVLILNAANHLTQSAREFLTAAAVEKMHVFFVVNKIDLIKDVCKCQSKILQQIKEILPATYENSSSLIHFTNLGCSSDELEADCALQSSTSSFAHVKQCLEEFIVENRIVSKLMPVKTYISNLVLDVERLLEYNICRCKESAQQLRDEIRNCLPEYEDLVRKEPYLRRQVHDTSERYYRALSDVVAAGLRPLPASLEGCIMQTRWRGISGVFRFKADIDENVKAATLKILQGLAEEADLICHSAVHDLESCAGEYLKNDSSRLHVPSVSWTSLSSPSVLQPSSVSLFDIFKNALPKKVFALTGSVVSALLATHLSSGLMPVSFLGSSRIAKLALISFMTMTAWLSLFSDTERVVKAAFLKSFCSVYCDSGFMQNIGFSFSADLRIYLSSMANEIYVRYTSSINAIKTEWDNKANARKRIDGLVIQLNDYFTRCQLLKGSVSVCLKDDA